MANGEGYERWNLRKEGVVTSLKDEEATGVES